MRAGRRRLLAAALALAAAALLYLPLCDRMFDCGCTWAFAGGARHCNVHAPRPPHCPLCAGPRALGLSFGLLLWGALYLPAALVLRPRP